MNVAASIITRPATVPIDDLLGAKLRTAVDRCVSWHESGDSSDRPGWLARFRHWQREDPLGSSLSDGLALIDQQLSAAEDGRIRNRLLTLFRLNSSERDLLDCALALFAIPALGETLRRLRPGAPTGLLCESLVTEIFAHPAGAIVRPSSPLSIWGLIEQGPVQPGLGRAIYADPDIAAAVYGKPGLDRRLAECARVVQGQDVHLTSWPVDATSAEIARLIEMNRSVRVAIRGAPGEGRLQFACAVAEALGSKVLLVSPSSSADEANLYMCAQRLALLTGHALYWDGAPPAASPMVASAPVQFVALDRGKALGAQAGLLDLTVDLPHLKASERQAIWRALAPENWGDNLSGGMLMGARLGDLLDCALHAPRDSAHAINILEDRVRGRLESAGELLDQPYDWDDLVLPERQTEMLRSLVTEIRSRESLLAKGNRLAKYGGLGQSALLHGPPGTGKTTAAQILARELRVQLVRIDCASIVSKYIGDTARNLRSCFDCVSGSGALLFFDECDSLFARRTEIKDAHDRHANADTNYLLQLIDSFDGAALLATNKKDNVEPAFIRRLRHVIDFPSPGVAERKTLWAHHIVALSDARIPSRKVKDWAARLSQLDLTPAQIKGAALSSAFLRASRGRDAPQLLDLVNGIERELAKDGRGIDRLLRERLLR